VLKIRLLSPPNISLFGFAGDGAVSSKDGKFFDDIMLAIVWRPWNRENVDLPVAIICGTGMVSRFAMRKFNIIL